MAKVHDIGGWSGGKVVGVWTDIWSVIWVSEETSGDIEFLKPSVITYIYKLTLHQGPTLTGMESTKSTPRKDKKNGQGSITLRQRTLRAITEKDFHVKAALSGVRFFCW